jgi:hypothetical protein
MYLVSSAGIKGLGVFATKLIPRGTRIISERPAFGIRHDQGPGDVYLAFRLLRDNDRAKVLELSGHATKKLELMRWVHVLWYTARSGGFPSLRSLQQHKALLNIFRSNAFSLNSGSRFSQAIFPQIARMNHTCIPNAQANFNDQTDRMNVHALRDIVPEEEITLCYLDDAGEMWRQGREQNLASYGFKCDCPICDIYDPAADKSAERRLDIMNTMLQIRDMPEEKRSKAVELEALMKIIELMRKEGVAGRELAARYFGAAQMNKELGELDQALKCAEEGLRVDEYSLGTDHTTYWKDLGQVNEYRTLLQARGPQVESLTAPMPMAAHS